MENVNIKWKNDDTGESGETHLVQFVPYTMRNGSIVQTRDVDGEREERKWVFVGGYLQGNENGMTSPN